MSGYYSNNTLAWRGYWGWVNVQTVIRPSRLLTQEEKNTEAYASTCGRFYLGKQIDTQSNLFRQCYATNAAYAVGARWGEVEDEKLFLGDTSSPTGRVALFYPIVQPTLTRLRGMAENISVTPIAEAATQFAKTRKEDRLNEAKLMSMAAASGPMMTGAYAPMGISPDEDETEAMVESNYQDDLVKAVTSLMLMVAEDNGLDDQKRDVAQSIALSGLAAFHASVQGSKLVWELCDPNEVLWDPSCLRPDFADGEYVATMPLYSVSTIGERWQPKRKAMEELDRWSNINNANFTNAGWPQSRPRVFTVYWKDTDYVDRGYVMKDGELHLCTINQPDPESRDGKPKYTEADLVTPPENKYTAAWTDAEWRQKYQRKFTEQLRYCTFIPWEYLPGPYTGNMKYSDRMKSPGVIKGGMTNGDLVLDHGVCDLQEADPDDTYLKGFPLKFSSWSYIAGNVVAPLTAAISPQRVMNQITSDLMWRLRKAGNKSVVYDSGALVGSSMSQDEVNDAFKEGDPVDLQGALVGSLTNAVREVDTSPGASFYKMFELLPQVKAIAESGTGVYDANFGAPQSGDQLVGTLQLQLQQAGVMQVPFNACLANLYKQVHQYDAQAGKQHYARFPWILSQMTGDNGAETLIVSKDMQNEQFRIKIELTTDTAQMKIMTATQIIPGLIAEGSLDQLTAAKLRAEGAFPTDAYLESYAFLKQAQLVAQQQQQELQQQQQRQAVALEQAGIRDEEAQIAEQQTKADIEMAKVKQKAAQPMLAAEASHFEKEDPLINPTGV